VSDQPQVLMRNYGIFTAVFFVVCAVYLVFANVTMIRMIRKELEMLKKAAQELSVGNVDIQLRTEFKDEFGELSKHFAEVARTMQEQANVARMVAEGNLTIDVETKGDDDALNHALRNMVFRNKSALTGINESATQVNTAAHEVASASEALAQGSTEQASAIEEITASIDDVAEKTKANAEEATKAAELFGTAIVNVRKGNEQMAEMIDAMNQINESSEKINKIIKVIDDIAFQTNILALNAAVEAARAGDAGKGFAVVAEEVRNLAAKSAQAASETAELIEDSIHKVSKGSDIANDTAKALDVITEAVSESEEIIRGIADASNYQATAISQIEQAINQVSMVVQTNSATSEECAAASVELSNQASRMQDLLAVYQLGANTATPVTKAEVKPFVMPIEDAVTHTVANTEPVLDENNFDLTPTPTFSELGNFSTKNAEDIISLGDDFGKY